MDINFIYVSLFFLSPQERVFLTVSNYIFTAIFVAEMTVKVNSQHATGHVLNENTTLPDNDLRPTS